MPYCSKCGSQVEEDSLFCERCGSRVKQIMTSSRINRSEVRDTHPVRKMPNQYSRYGYQSRKGNSPRHRMSFIPIVLVIAIGLLGVITINGLLGLFGMVGQNAFTYDYKGTQTIGVPIDNNTSSLKLNLKNNIGSTTISSEPDFSYVFQGTIEIWGRDSADMREARTITYNTEGSVVSVEFTSDWYQGQNNTFSYEFNIIVTQGIEVELDVETSTGGIEIEMSGVNVTALNLHSSTGNPVVSFDHVSFSDSNPEIHTSTGNIELSLTNINYSSNTPLTTWLVDTSTGNIEFDLIQQINDFNKSTIRTFNFDTSTGNILVNSNMLSDYRVRVNAHSSLGSVRLPNGDDELYQMVNYSSAKWQIKFDLHTSTGNVNFY
ncbi:MAG: zinc-ribbon domain-containing protein [Candidatus Hodarchaeales archaeon]